MSSRTSKPEQNAEALEVEDIETVKTEDVVAEEVLPVEEDLEVVEISEVAEAEAEPTQVAEVAVAAVVIPESVEVEVVAEPAAQVLNLAVCVYSAKRKNSTSVALLQDRLAACNYSEVRADLKGWFHDNTVKALSRWQKENGLEATGVVDAEEMAFLFDGTDVVIA